MSVYVYFLLTPEALVVSMLPPKEFGTYLAVGTEKRAHGQAIYFTVNNKELEKTDFNIEDAKKRCVPHSDGQPKHSVYVSIYRVMERIPLKALQELYLVTPDGKVLELKKSDTIMEKQHKYNLYQELCPVHSRIVSHLKPVDFIKYITDPNHNLYVPKISFVDLHLGELSEDPEHGKVGNLPYYSVEHLRDCLKQLKENPEKHTKTVNRINPQWFPYRTIETGFYIGDNNEILFYRFPEEEELQRDYFDWWRSASIMGDSFGTSF